LKKQLLWGSSLLAYSFFFGWYTNLSGPLTDEEIESYLLIVPSSSIYPKRIERLEQFMRSDTGDDFVMINLIDMNEAPPILPVTGQNAEANDLMDHYLEHMYVELLKRASHPVFVGAAVANALEIIGIEGASHWDSGALIRYRSRRDLLDIALDPMFGERHDYKLAALSKTIAYPVKPSLNFGDLRFQLASLLIALTSIIHLLVFTRKQ
jgi:hypothetical protein